MELLFKGQVAYDASAALALAGQARALHDSADVVIDSEALLHIAAADLRQVKALLRDVEQQRSRITQPLQEALAAVNELFREPRSFLERAEARLKAAILAYTQLQQEQHAAAQREAEMATRQAQAQLKDEAARHEQQAQAAQQQWQQAQRALQAAQQAGDHEAVAQAQRSAALAGDTADRAQAQMQAASQTAELICVPPSVAPPRRAAGLATRVIWSAQVEDLAALVEAVARQQVPVQAICANEKFLAAQARAVQKEGVLYPGVVVVSRRSLAARAA